MSSVRSRASVFHLACLCSLPLAFLAQAWNRKVSSVVPGPYLDEIFHVPQAQAYCNEHFREYDPKLTTPPGLYLTIYIFQKLFRLTCDVTTIRFVNASLWSLPIVYSLLYILCSNGGVLHSKQSLIAKYSASHGWNTGIIHTACNIFLFPPLFFFLALFYTDVGSTALVLWTFSLSRMRDLSSPRALHDILLVFFGCVALTFRQTNIFWVAVFPAGVDAFQTLKISASAAASKYNPGIENGLRDVIGSSWKGHVIYDPPVDEAGLGDYLVMGLSMAVAAVANFRLVLRAILPYVVLLGLFATFVLWNGGVVLGDRSNHTVTLHTPQMLYIWAYFMFFSYPIILPRVLGIVLPVRLLPKFLQPYESSSTRLPRAISFAVFTILAVVAVQFNTIVHPFTLADNRHYVFYVFRILRLHPAFRYLAAPVYVLCGWASVQSLALPGSPSSKSVANSPVSPKTVDVPRGQGPDDIVTKPAFQLRRGQTMNSCSDSSVWENKGALRQGSDGEGKAMTASFAFMWIITCALNLITAPLVEPRYFILPWIFWRLHVPQAQTAIRWTVPPLKPVTPGTEARRRIPPPNPIMTRLRYYAKGVSSPLLAETGWFLFVNAVTGYVFLYWGFEWPQEPGVVQRFLY